MTNIPALSSQGPHPWSDFLRARRRAIRWLRSSEENILSFAEIARILSCDPLQIELIAYIDPEETGKQEE